MILLLLHKQQLRLQITTKVGGLQVTRRSSTCAKNRTWTSADSTKGIATRCGFLVSSHQRGTSTVENPALGGSFNISPFPLSRFFSPANRQQDRETSQSKVSRTEKSYRQRSSSAEPRTLKMIVSH